LCWASDTLLLIFNKQDSVVQIQLSFVALSRDSLANAETLWRLRAQSFSDMMGRLPDSIPVKPSEPFTVKRWSDPRGLRAQVLRACWLTNRGRRWRGNVWLYDAMSAPDTAITRALVEVFMGAASRPGCYIGPAS
jgi:hypothetical protein